LRNFCFVSIVKRGAYIATQFFTHVFDKFSEKNKNSKKTMKTPKKKAFLIYLHHFSIFNVILEEFKFSKVF